jgi:hypothetical protein
MAPVFLRPGRPRINKTSFYGCKDFGLRIGCIADALDNKTTSHGEWIYG